MTSMNKSTGSRRGRGPSRPLIAHHEAGHAVVASVLGTAVVRATIVPMPGYRGHVLFDGADREQSILVSYAGPLAAARYEGRTVGFALGRLGAGRVAAAVSHCGGGTDLPQACKAAGLANQFSDRRERTAYLRWLWERSRVLVREHWPEIEAVAAELLARRTLTGAQLRRVLERVERDGDAQGEEVPGWLAARP